MSACSAYVQQPTPFTAPQERLPPADGLTLTLAGGRQQRRLRRGQSGSASPVCAAVDAARAVDAATTAESTRPFCTVLERAQACTIEGSIASIASLPFERAILQRRRIPCSQLSGPAAAARARPISLQTIAIEAGSISGRGQGSRLQASDGSQACSARSPGAAPPLTMLARRGIHSGRR